MLGNKDGFGISPTRESPTKQTEKTMLRTSQSPERKSIHGGDKLVQ